jgi:hypothetical protein
MSVVKYTPSVFIAEKEKFFTITSNGKTKQTASPRTYTLTIPDNLESVELGSLLVFNKMDTVRITPGIRHIYNAIINGRKAFSETLESTGRLTNGHLYFSNLSISSLVKAIERVLATPLSKANEECTETLGVSFGAAYGEMYLNKRNPWQQLSAAVSHDIIGLLFGLNGTNGACVFYMDGLISVTWNTKLEKFNVTKLYKNATYESVGYVVPFDLEAVVYDNSFHRHIRSVYKDIENEPFTSTAIIGECHSRLWVAMFSLALCNASAPNEPNELDQRSPAKYTEVHCNGLSMFKEEPVKYEQVVTGSEQELAFKGFKNNGIKYHKGRVAIKSKKTETKVKTETATATETATETQKIKTETATATETQKTDTQETKATCKIKPRSNLSHLMLLCQSAIIENAPQLSTSFGRKMEVKLETTIGRLLQNTEAIMGMQQKKGICLVLGQEFISTLNYIKLNGKLLNLFPNAKRYFNELTSGAFFEALTGFQEALWLHVNYDSLNIQNDEIDAMQFASMIHLKYSIFSQNHTRKQKTTTDTGKGSPKNAHTDTLRDLVTSTFKLLETNLNNDENFKEFSIKSAQLAHHYVRIFHDIRQSPKDDMITGKIKCDDKGYRAALCYLFSEEELLFNA